jgi:hypothetical protein
MLRQKKKLKLKLKLKKHERYGPSFPTERPDPYESMSASDLTMRTFTDTASLLKNPDNIPARKKIK